MPTRFEGALRRRFPFLFFPLEPYRDTVDATEPSGHLDEHLAKARYSLRLQRYWWAASKIREEVPVTGRLYVVVDLGCGCGWLKRFTRPNPCIRWIGLDGDTNHPALSASGYDEIITCNFSEPFPLPGECADAVVSLHVFEHLHDADLAASEVARVLKPGGVFLAGTPGAPLPVAALRTAFLRRRDRAGRNRRWGHVRKFSPPSWCRLCEAAGLGVEFITGSHLTRRTGSAIENSRWWARFNQIWGGLFPSLGSELYLSARKPLEGQTRPPRPGVLERLWLRTDWAAPIVAALMLVFGAFSMHGGSATAAGSSFVSEITSLQDGNDVFAWAVQSRAISQDTASLVNPAAYNGDLDAAIAEFRAQGRDLHLIIDDERVDHYLKSSVADSIHVSAEWHRYGDRFVVLTNEDGGPTLQEYMRARNASGG